jgi:8-oxo-dGTP diphosphatase
MKQFVLGFIFSKERVLLIQKAKPEWQKGFMNGIGGKINEFEHPHVAMQRECREETGINIGTDAWHLCITMEVPNLDSKVYIFRTFQDFRTIHQVDLNRSDNPDEILCVSRLDDLNNKNFLGADIIPNLKFIIPMLLDKNISIPLNITYHQALG